MGQSLCTGCNKKSSAIALLLLRIFVGTTFLAEGIGKFGPFHSDFFIIMSTKLAFLPGNFHVWVYFIGLLEMLGGLGVLLGVQARLASVWLGSIMVVALITVHRGGPLVGYVLPFIMLLGCVAIKVCGSGRYSVLKKDCTCENCEFCNQKNTVTNVIN